MADSRRVQDGWMICNGMDFEFLSDEELEKTKPTGKLSGHTFCPNPGAKAIPIENYKDPNVLDLSCSEYLHSEEFKNAETRGEIKAPEKRSMRPVQEAVENFTKTPYWKNVYLEAPSELSRRWRELDFAISWENYYKLDTSLWDTYTKEQNDLESRMSIEDFEYLLKYCNYTPLRSKYMKRIKELREENNHGT